MVKMKNRIKEIKKEIEKELNEKLEWQKRAIKYKNKDQEIYCNGALTQIYDFLGKIKELEKLL